MSEQTYNWSQKSPDELASFYAREIAPERRRSGADPSEVPSYQWLVDHGFSGLQYTLREHHDLTLTEFFENVVGLDRDTDDSYTWGVDAVEIVEHIEQYFMSQERGGAVERTLRSKRSRIAQYLRLYEDLHGSADIVKRISDLDDQPTEIQRVTAVFDQVDDQLESNDAKRRYRSDVDDLYDWLVDRGYGAFNPVRHDHAWDVEDYDNPALSSRQVEALADEANDLEEQLIVYGLCAWGLRRNELAGLSVRNVELQTDDPFLTFENRKNGPGTVALIYGAPLIQDRITQLSDRDTWTGHLLPSPTAGCSHITGETVNRRFKRIAERAGVRVRGSTPTSKMGRRFWYTVYADAVEDVVERLQTIAEDQGSSDPMVVFRNYLSEEKRRDYLREAMREKLSESFA